MRLNCFIFHKKLKFIQIYLDMKQTPTNSPSWDKYAWRLVYYVEEIDRNKGKHPISRRYDII